MLRDLLGNSIVVLITLSAFFFSLIFLLSVADNTKTNNSIENQVPMQQAEQSRWGAIPGDFAYNLIRKVQIYSTSTGGYLPEQNELILVEQPLGNSFIVDRTFVDP